MIFFISVMVCKLTSLGLKYGSQVTGHNVISQVKNSSHFSNLQYSRFSFFGGVRGVGGGM